MADIATRIIGTEKIEITKEIIPTPSEPIEFPTPIQRIPEPTTVDKEVRSDIRTIAPIAPNTI
jgi:hypothetical protein